MNKFLKKSKILFWGPKMPHLPRFGRNKNSRKNQNSHFKSFFKQCHQIQFKKKSNEKIKRKSSNVLILGHNMTHFHHFWHIKNFP